MRKLCPYNKVRRVQPVVKQLEPHERYCRQCGVIFDWTPDSKHQWFDTDECLLRYIDLTNGGGALTNAKKRGIM